MGAGKTCTKGKWVDIDIGKTETKPSYKDPCKNNITIAKNDNPSGLNGYKKYTHRFSRLHYVGGIYYNREKQDSIKVTDAGLYEKSVTVYYLDYDVTNALPLIVGLEKTWLTNEYYYYKKTSYTSASNQWKDEDRSVKQENQLPEKLSEISTKLTGLVVLNLRKINGKYYANGDTSSPPTINEDLQIQVTGPSTEYTIYKKYKHAPTGGKSNIRPLSTKNYGKNIPFDPPVYGTWCSEVYVYFWKEDSGHTNPLLLELKPTSGASSYYTLTSGGGKRWTKQSGITVGKLKTLLDRENCKRNYAHVVDISKTSKSGYICPSCNSKRVTVFPANRSDYSYCFHYLTGGSFYRVKNRGTEQTGITFPSTISSVFVYRYPKGPDGIPLLIYLPLSSNKWFERESLTSNNWTDVKDGNKPTSTFDKDKILKLLNKILPTVTINVGQTGISISGQHTTYRAPSGDGGGEQKQINLKRNNLYGNDVGFSHHIQDKSAFILGGITHNGLSLQGIPQNLVVKSVKAFYDGKNPTDKKNLLMLEFEKNNHGPRNNYVYYQKESKDKSGFTLLSEQKNKIDGDILANQLAEIKEKLETKTGDGSNAGAIAGGVFGTGLSGTAIGVGIWKGKVIVKAIVSVLKAGL
ncbi:hypothetical protein BEWA_015810 [Theileria equi strain WA]|uniref:Uncharacterized protein n=1 Tax=Theileria equi strain WA TaxID=1537102 RepID=L1LCP5_THEEQ|nr:hypothetical protein BEWA_015810 [Theileria equi strain WA]EKX73020.1 hypothetical protein BEWA_015810 [Theileria equi strain WA]|eukprot:XP_004832472.1 hypothetical protein BEWA_015810 [Theileria equi strain WA]